VETFNRETDALAGKHYFLGRKRWNCRDIKSSRARVCSQRYRIGRGDDGNVDVLSQMMSDTIQPSITSVHIGHGVVFFFPYIK
jgi:hypothetical protein